MFIFSPLLPLLQLPPASDSDLPAWVPSVVPALIAILITLYLNARKEAREDGLTPSQRQKKMEMAQIDMSLRQNGFQQEIERAAEFYRLSLASIREDHRRDFDSIRDQVRDIPLLRDDVTRLKTQLSMFTETAAKLENKMEKLVDLMLKPRA